MSSKDLEAWTYCPKLLSGAVIMNPAKRPMRLWSLVEISDFEFCTPTSYSFESNGMVEGVVIIFKRDYVWFVKRSDARTVVAQLSDWFETFNERVAYKGLKMHSP